MNKMEYRSELVYENIQVSDNIYKLSIKGKFNGKPGQFYMLRAWNQEPLLPRPISIYDLQEDRISFLYQVIGEGTEILSKLSCGDGIKLTGPLGNSFPIEEIKGRVAVIGGGIGNAPMIYLAKELKECKIDFYSGFRDKVYAIDEIESFVNNIIVVTERGDTQNKGYVTEFLNPEDYDIVVCCGPEIMMKKVVNMCKEKKVPVYISMEKHMACGVGACLVCTCKTKNGNKRTCKDGPVFKGEEIIF